MPDILCLIPGLHPAPLQKNKRITKTRISHCGSTEKYQNNNQPNFVSHQDAKYPNASLGFTLHLVRKTKDKPKPQLAMVAQK